MKYRNLVVAALISLLTISCQKESFEDVTPEPTIAQTTITQLPNSGSRGSDDDDVVILTGLVSQAGNVLQDGDIDIIAEKNGEVIQNILTDQNGAFSTSLLSGTYALQVFKDGNFIGSSEEIIVGTQPLYIELVFP